MSSEAEPARSRASQVFEAWLLRRARGRAEPFEQLLADHPDLRASLEALRRSDAQREAALPDEPHGAIGEPRTFGDYRILRQLGEGAMGIVYEAEQISLRRRVALKILKPQHALNDRALKRFRHEAEITGRLKHPHIIDVHQVGVVDGVHFISMELVEGTSLDRVIESLRRQARPAPQPAGPPPAASGDVLEVHGLEDAAVAPWLSGRSPRDARRASTSVSNKSHIEGAVRLVCQVADALDHAHRAGVLHRDVKPSNVLVRPDGSAVLTDFGLAREEGLPTVSQTGDFVGTAHYVSPEQAMAGRMPVDGRSDVFSLGATLYELLTLELAFPGDSLHSVLSAVVSKPPRNPARLNPVLANDLVTIVFTALEKDPDLRYASAAELAKDLRAFIDYRPIGRKPRRSARAMRWVRREPLKASLAAVLVLGLPSIGVLGLSLSRERAIAEARARELDEARLPIVLERGFLALGTGDLPTAERLFAEVRAHAPESVEAVAGQALALLAAERPDEAEDLLAEVEDGVTSSSVLGRLRVQALRQMRRSDEASALERQIAPESGHLDRFLRAMLLIKDAPFLVGAPSPALLLVPSSSERSPARRSGGEESDTFVKARERAREAYDLLTRAIDVESDRAIYHFARAWAVWLLRDADAASRAADAILERWSDHCIALFYAGLADEVVDMDAAIASYDTAIALDPDFEAARARRANAHLERRDLDTAITQLEDLVARFPDQVVHRVKLASARIEAGQLDAALSAARSALEREPDCVPALDALGTVYFRRNEMRLAEEAFRKAAELESTGARLWNDLGVVQLAQGRPEEARDSLQNALRLDPDRTFAAYNLGAIALREDDAATAAMWFERALETLETRTNEDFPAQILYGALGKARARLQQDPLEAYRAGVEVAPDDPALNAELGLALWARNELGGAVPHLQRGLPLDRDGGIHRALLDCHMRRSDWMAALAAARSWSEHFQASPHAWNFRASLQVDPCRDVVGDVGDGLAAATRARELAPEDPNVLDTYACALLANQRPRDALDFALEALDRAEANGMAAATLAEMYRHVERIEAAIH